MVAGAVGGAEADTRKGKVIAPSRQSLRIPLQRSSLRRHCGPEAAAAVAVVGAAASSRSTPLRLVKASEGGQKWQPNKLITERSTYRDVVSGRSVCGVWISLDHSYDGNSRDLGLPCLVRWIRRFGRSSGSSSDLWGGNVPADRWPPVLRLGSGRVDLPDASSKGPGQAEEGQSWQCRPRSASNRAVGRHHRVGPLPGSPSGRYERQCRYLLAGVQGEGDSFLLLDGRDRDRQRACGADCWTCSQARGHGSRCFMAQCRLPASTADHEAHYPDMSDNYRELMIPVRARMQPPNHGGHPNYGGPGTQRLREEVGRGRQGSHLRCAAGNVRNVRYSPRRHGRENIRLYGTGSTHCC